MPVNLVEQNLITENAYYSAGSLPRQSKKKKEESLELWKAHQHFIAKCHCSD